MAERVSDAQRAFDAAAAEETIEIVLPGQAAETVPEGDLEDENEFGFVAVRVISPGKRSLTEIPGGNHST